MLRLLALSLLALAAPQAAAQQVHPCQAETPPCSVGRPLPQSYLDRYAGNEKPALIHTCQAENPPCSLGLAQTLRELDELTRDPPLGIATDRYNGPRHHVPYPLSRELLTGAVNPCDRAPVSCPPKLDRIYDGLSEARRRDDQSRLEMYQRSLRYYYRTYQP